MKPCNNHDKFELIKTLIVLNMLQQPCCFINVNKTSKKSSTKVKNNINQNNLSVKKNMKNEMDTTYILPIQELNIEDDTKCIKKEHEIISSCTLPLTNGVTIIPVGINGPLESKIPVVIAEKTIDIPIESTFKLKNAALDVKTIKKDVYLTNSKLLPLYAGDNISSSTNGKLFLEGFVRNKLDFSISKGVHESIINLDTECVIIYIPFKCTTLIQYNSPPTFSKEKTLDYIPIYVPSESIIINKDNNSNINEYPSKKNTQCSEYINCDIEAIHCEIKEAKIYETYTLMDKTPFNKDFPIETNFHSIKENIIINLTLTFFQKQDVAINSIKEPK